MEKKTESSNSTQIYALSYGKNRYLERKVLDAGRNSRISFEWMFWLIKHEGRNILLDTGFDDPRLAGLQKFRNFNKPQARLAQLGLQAKDITDVIISHGHWDHIAALHLYNRARVWMQRSEFEYMKSRLNRDHQRHSGMFWEHLRELEKCQREGRLQLIDGTANLDGIRMEEAIGHTFGSQFVVVPSGFGDVVLAVDNGYLYQNNLAHIPIASAKDKAGNLESIHRMQNLAASPLLIIPGHDPKVMKWFPEVSEGIVEIRY